MNDHILLRAAEYLGKRRKHAKWKKIVGVLAMVVVFCTAYALILPAITKERTLICGMEEHSHEETCYTEQRTLLCEEDETESHSHDDFCFLIEEIRTCGFEEHTHVEACYQSSQADPNADIESAVDWEQTMSHIALTGDWSKDVIAVAESQLGYTESDLNYVENEDGTISGYSRYGAWYGHPYGPWDAMFVSFCLDYADVMDIPLNDDCVEWIAMLSQEPYAYYRSAASYTPEQGDLIFFDTNSDAVADHVGLVKEVTLASGTHGAKIKTIEGDSNNTVQYAVYDLTDEDIMGYGQLPNENGQLPVSETAETELGTETDDAVKMEVTAEEVPETDTEMETESASILESKKEDETEPEIISEADQARITHVISVIDELSTYEEIEEVLAVYEKNEDWEGYESYYLEMAVHARTAYAWYEDLGPELRNYVPDEDEEKVLSMTSLWSAMTLSIKDTTTVYQVNSYSEAVTTIAYGGTVRDAVGSGMSYAYWDAIIVEEDSNGRLYVDQYITDDTDKRDYKAATANGFVLLLYNTSVDAAVGDTVTVSFDYKTAKTYSSSGHGEVRFGDTAALKPDKDNTDQLTVIQGADTRDLITVNLYNYGNNINDLYDRTTNTYPGFQQEYGTIGEVSSLGNGNFNFGNNVTEDLAAGESNVTVKNGTHINATTGTYNGVDYGTANIPISGVMSSTLNGRGYPELANGTSLEYLFSDNAYAEKLNTENINGLFQYNGETGAYIFNSRENHAQFNASGNTFTLYEQIITPNYMMYPFGNFLPLNDITKDSMQVSQIDRAYLQTIANSAQYKQEHGYSTYKVTDTATVNNEYGNLSTALSSFITTMDEAQGNTSWGAVETINSYFDVSNIPKRYEQGDASLANMYSLDYDVPTNFYFGLEMKMNFIQPKNGLTGLTGQEPMVFYFTGDDDVWVYVDDILFLDLSGIHRHVGGEIDFTNGTVKYYTLDKTTGDVSGTPYKTVTFAKILGTNEGLNEKGAFRDYSEHSFNFYYMERGSGSGVCRMNFNLPLLKENAVSVTKELSVDDELIDVLGNLDYKFQILKEDGETSLVGANAAYEVYDSAGHYIKTAQTDGDGIFAIKAGQTARFPEITENSGKYFVRELLEKDIFGQYGQFYVDGTSITTDSYTDTTIGTDQFTGVDSPMKDISDGNTSFVFTNYVDTSKLANLEISKVMEGEMTEREFNFLVKLDDEKLPVGTTYVVTRTDGTTEERTVTTAGMITLKAGEKAGISNILAGSTYFVQETLESAYGYTVTYTGDGKAVSTGTDENGSYAYGETKLDATITASVTNSTNSVSVDIPVTKILKNPDGASHIYNISLIQVTDQTGSTIVDQGLAQMGRVEFSGDKTSVPLVFTIPYYERDIETYPCDFYYKIAEVVDETDTKTIYDAAAYVVKTRIEKDADGNLTASIAGLYRDGGEQTIPDAPLPMMTFTNTQLYQMTISKTVKGLNENDAAFDFDITLKDQDANLLTGTFDVIHKAADGTETEETMEFVEGKATLTLKSGEFIQISGLTYGMTWELTEKDALGYKVTYSVNQQESQEGETATGRVDAQVTVAFVNEGEYELPETGGEGSWGLFVGGVILVMFAAFMLLRRWRKGGA